MAKQACMAKKATQSKQACMAKTFDQLGSSRDELLEPNSQ